MKSLLCFLAVMFSFQFTFARSMAITMPNADPLKPHDLYLIVDFKKGNFSKKLIQSMLEGPYFLTSQYLAFIHKGKLSVITDFETLEKKAIADKVLSAEVTLEGSLVYIVKENPETPNKLFILSDAVTAKPNLILESFSSYKLQDN